MKPSSTVHQFGSFEFDPSQHELRNAGDRTTLPAALNRLLLLFVTRPGELVTRDEIANALWEDQSTVDVVAGINTAIKRLRTQLGDNNGQGVFIETVVGAGYRFAAPVTVPNLNADLNADLKVPDSPPESIASPPRRLLAPALAALLVLLAAIAGWTLYSSRRAAGHAADSPNTPLLLHSRPVTFDEPEDRLTAQAISPSGTYLAYADRAGITLHTLATAEDRLLDTPKSLTIERIAWAPGERTLLVSGTAAAASQTWRISLTGEPAQLLLDDAALAAVSPTDGRIAALRAHRTEVWICGPNGEAPHLFLKAPYGDTFTSLLWSPRGDRIVLDRNRPRLPVLAGADLNAKDAGPPTPDKPQNGAIYESYSAANGALLASRDGLRFDSALLLQDGTLLYPLNAPPNEATLVLVKTDPATGAVLAPERLIPSHQVWSSYMSYRMAQLSASTDGKTLSALLDRNATDVYTADLATKPSGSPTAIEHIARLTRHTGSSYPTAWSPDGSQVVFDNGTGGPIAIAAQPLDGSPFKVLAESRSGLSKFAQGQFSPDGRWLLFLALAMDSSQVQSIQRVPAKGGIPEVLHTTGTIQEFHCSASPAGRCVLREVDGKKSLVYYALDPVLGIGQELARTPWQGTLLGDWSLSPDGANVAMASHDPTHPAIQILALPPTSAPRPNAAVRELPLPGFGTTLAAHWSADGKGVFVETYTGTQYDLVWLGLDGHAALLSQSAELLWAIPSPDGRKIAFPGPTPLNRNVWIGSTNPH